MKAHRTDLLSFAFGLLFLALSAWWLLAQLLGLALPPVGWFLAGALILIGVFGLVGALRSGRSGRPEPNEIAEPGTTDAATVTHEPVSVTPEPGTAERGTPQTAAFEPVTFEPATFEPTPDATPTAELRTPEPPTADVVHPAWLAHAPAEPETPPDTAEPAEPAQVDHPVTQADAKRATGPAVGDAPAGDDDPTVGGHPASDDAPGVGDERTGRRESS